MRKRLRKFWIAWKERNRIAFDSEAFLLNRLKKHFVFSLRSWFGFINYENSFCIRLLTFCLKG